MLALPDPFCGTQQVNINVLAKWLSQSMSFVCAVASTYLGHVSVCTIPRLTNSSWLPHPEMSSTCIQGCTHSCDKPRLKTLPAPAWGALDQDMQTMDPGPCTFSEDLELPRPSTPKWWQAGRHWANTYSLHVTTLDQACHGRIQGADQACAIQWRCSRTRAAEACRRHIGNKGVRRVGGGSCSLRPHGEQWCSPVLNNHAGGRKHRHDKELEHVILCYSYICKNTLFIFCSLNNSSQLL